MRQVILIGTIAILLGACTAAPQRSEQLEQARAQIQTLSQEPLAQEAAARDLEAARYSCVESIGHLSECEPANANHH
jgi:starvation-inducible outer membrane lipoprotein